MARQKGRKYVPGAAKKSKDTAPKTKKATRSAAGAPARPKHRGHGNNSSTGSVMGLLRDTLIPRSKAAAHMAARAQQVKDREKLHAEDFSRVKSSVICQGVWLFLLATLWSGACFYVSFESNFSLVTMAMGGVGALSLLANLLGIMGAKFESDRLLLSYMSFQTCIVLMTLFFSTFTMILTEQLVREMELKLAVGDPVASRSTLQPDNLRIVMYAIGGLSLLQVPMQGYAVKNTGRLLTTMRAVSNFMETLTLLMFPIGCVFVAGGVYVINTIQNDATSAITALFIFAIGCFIIMLSALGYFGTMIHSRGMLLMFQWPVLLMVTVLFGFGIWSTVQAEVVKFQLNEYWEDIRRFLPTTFEGRYDRVLFGEFISSNLQMIAFGCFYTGVFFLFCAFGAGLMRQGIKVEHLTLKEAEKREMLSMERMEFEAERQREVVQLEQETGLSHAEAEHVAEEHMRHKLAHGDEWIKKHKTQFHKKWKEAWTKGSKFSRCLVRITCASVCVVLIIVVGCGLAFLVYASFCEGLDAECVETSMMPMDTGHTVLLLDNNYTRGKIIIASGVDNADALPAAVVSKSENGKKLAVVVSSCAIQGDFKDGTLSANAKADPGVLHYTLEPVPDPPEFFGVDTSCQKITMGVALPAPLVATDPTLDLLKVRSDATVKISGSDGLMLGAVSIDCGNSATEFKKLHVDYKNAGGADETNRAVSIQTQLGEVRGTGDSCVFDPSKEGGDGSLYVHATRSNIKCSNKVFVSTVNGFITMKDLEITNCDLKVVSLDSGPTVLKDIVTKCSDSTPSTNDGKFCHYNNVIDITAGRGSVELNRIVSDAIAIRTEEGRVNMKEITQLNPESGITVTTVKGNVNIEYLVAAGNIQIETKTGDVNISIPMCNEVPAYFGTFQIAYGNTQKPGEIFYPPAQSTTKFDLDVDGDKKFVIMDDLDAAAATGQLTGTIGCHLDKGSTACAYANELLISTQEGRVRVTINENRNICLKTTTAISGTDGT